MVAPTQTWSGPRSFKDIRSFAISTPSSTRSGNSVAPSSSPSTTSTRTTPLHSMMMPTRSISSLATPWNSLFRPATSTNWAHSIYSPQTAGAKWCPPLTRPSAGTPLLRVAIVLCRDSTARLLTTRSISEVDISCLSKTLLVLRLTWPRTWWTTPQRLLP